MSFSGFSEDDIKHLANQKAKVESQSKKNATFKSNGVNTKKTKPKSMLINNNEAINAIPDGAKLAKPVETSESNGELVSVVSANGKEESDLGRCSKPDNSATCDEKATSKYKDLDEFEARQKLIEEQNRKRKELLAKALADRTKQTQEEAMRLGQIQEEFKKLDACLANDVKLLRKQIEVASFDYAETEKRYIKIEKEFLQAKFQLHQKLEKKELLTEHLCAIIEKNEERKAQKLDELLDKLHVKDAISKPESKD